MVAFGSETLISIFVVCVSMKKDKEKEVVVGSPASGEDIDDKQRPSFPPGRFSTRNASSKYDFVKVWFSISPSFSLFLSLPFSISICFLLAFRSRCGWVIMRITTTFYPDFCSAGCSRLPRYPITTVSLSFYVFICFFSFKLL